MEDLELIQRMKKGELAAFEEWLDRYAEKIVQLAYQYGCTKEEASDLAEQAFSSLFIKVEEIVDEAQLVDMMYHIIIEKLANVEIAETEDLLFEEDRKLHHKIIRLEQRDKLVLILSSFQELRASQIAIIMDLEEEVVLQIISEVMQNLDEQQLEKQLAFLNKSYQRMKFPFEKARALQFSTVNHEEVIERKPKLRKKTWVSLLTGGLVLVTLLLFSVLNSAEYKEASAQKYIEKLKVTFEEEVERVYNELGIEEEFFLGWEEDMGEGYFLFQEKKKFDLLIIRMEKALADKGQIDKSEFDPLFSELLTALDTPAKMVAEIIKNPLSNDIETSAEFMQKYLDKLLTIDNFYANKIFQNQQWIDELIAVGEGSSENIELFSEELQQLLLAMEKQNIYLEIITEGNYPVPKYKKGEVGDKLRASLHKDLGGYITMLEYVNPSESFEMSLEDLLEMEQSLLTSGDLVEGRYTLTYSYASLFIDMIKGTESGNVFGNNGKVKQEIRSEWEKIAEIGGNSPAAYIMQIIIEEMEKNDWAFSESYIFLDPQDIERALSDIQKDGLASFQLTGEEFDYNNSYSVISPWPDQAFDNLIMSIYERFTESYDVAILQERHPLIIFGLFYYANEKEDPKTMWYLQNGAGTTVSLEAYMSDWEPEVWLRDINSLSFDPHAQTVVYGKEDVYYDRVQMVLEGERWIISLYGIKNN